MTFIRPCESQWRREIENRGATALFDSAVQNLTYDSASLLQPPRRHEFSLAIFGVAMDLSFLCPFFRSPPRVIFFQAPRPIVDTAPASRNRFRQVRQVRRADFPYRRPSTFVPLRIHRLLYLSDITGALDEKHGLFLRISGKTGFVETN